MDKEKESRTSWGVATLRAAHQLIDPGTKILHDDAILRLLPPEIISHIREHPDRFNSPAARALRSHVLLRSRYAEDCLAEAFGRGVRQYIILGAGLDTFGCRQPDWAASMRIFELDHPASQQDKRLKLAHCGLPLPENVSFIPVDLEAYGLSTVLQNTAFHFQEPVFISWLGVMAYLRPATNDKILQFISSLPPSSELVFTFSRREEPGQLNPLAARADALHEPWLTRIEPDALAEKLTGFGFTSFSFLDPATAKARYYHDPEMNLPPPRRASIVRAVV